jgi:molybdopterin-binding protein
LELSARNQLKGRVTNVKPGTVMAEVEVTVEGGTVVAAITEGSSQRLNLAKGDEVTVIFKATEVMIGK